MVPAMASATNNATKDAPDVKDPQPGMTTPPKRWRAWWSSSAAGA